MRNISTLGVGLLALALSACGKDDASDRYLAAIPDAAGLALEIQGGSQEGLAVATAAEPAVAPAAVTGAPVTPDDLADARARIAALNQAVRAVFQHVEEIASGGGNELPGNVKIYGPADRCVQKDPAGACLATANLRLAIHMHQGSVASFALEARAVGSTDPSEFEPVLAGFLVRGPAERRGRGRLWVNHENLAAAAPGFLGRGYLVAGFGNGPVVRAVTYRMLGFTRDPAQHPAVTAAFSGFRTPNGMSRVRVAALGDFDQAGPDDELGVGRLVYSPSVGGRAFGVVRNWTEPATGTPHGDVPAGQYWFGRACYAPNATTPAFKEWFLCPVGQGPVACLVALGGWLAAEGEQVAGDPAATWASTCALTDEPPEFGPPPGPPSDDPSDDSAEPGQDAVGITPEAVPADPVNPDLAPPGP